MKLTRKDLINILGVNNNGLKSIISRGQLELRLQDKGYKLIKQYKEGRSIMYEVVKDSEDKEIYANICQYMFDTNKIDNFADYFLSRMMNLEKPITKEIISKKANIHRNTVTKWDNKMLENNILSKDGYFYIAVDYIVTSNNEKESIYRLTSKEEYANYMQTSKHAKKSAEIKRKYISGIIDLDEYTMLQNEIAISQSELERKFVYRVSKYNLIKNNKLYKDVFVLIKNIYKDKEIADYYEYWL